MAAENIYGAGAAGVVFEHNMGSRMSYDYQQQQQVVNEIGQDQGSSSICMNVLCRRVVMLLIKRSMQ